MAILLRESDVKKLASMEMALDAVEEAFRYQGEDQTENAPRRRCRLERGLLHVMSASIPTLKLAGLKSYTSIIGGQTRFHVLLYSADDGQLLAAMEADFLGRLRTGAASGVATKYMASPDASSLGIFGTGRQARSQLEAVCAVRPIRKIIVFSRDPERRRSFSDEMSNTLGISVEPAENPESAVHGMDIVVTATNSKEPVFDGRWLSEGTHINAVGSNHLSRQEIDVESVRRCDCVVVDSKEQSMMESGELAKAVEAGVFYWEDARELGLVVTGDFPGREDPKEITLFKSNGIALEDIALAGRIHQAALKAGAGEPLSL